MLLRIQVLLVRLRGNKPLILIDPPGLTFFVPPVSHAIYIHLFTPTCDSYLEISVDQDTSADLLLHGVSTVFPNRRHVHVGLCSKPIT